MRLSILLAISPMERCTVSDLALCTETIRVIRNSRHLHTLYAVIALGRRQVRAVVDGALFDRCVLKSDKAKSTKVFAVIAGAFIGVFVLKRFLKLRDTTILFFALARFACSSISHIATTPCSYSASSIPIAFATDTSMELSNYFLVFGGLGLATLSSLMTQFVEEDEVRNVCALV